MARRRWPIWPMLALAACSTASPGPDSEGPQAPDRWVIAGSQAVALQLEKSPSSTSIVIPEPADEVLRAVADAYGDLGIPLTTIDPSGGVVGNRSFQVSRSLADERLSRFLSCGTVPSGGQAADRYPVQMDITTRTEALGTDTTRVTTRLSASARNPSGTSNDRIRCSSRGVLEQGILKRAYGHLYDL